MAKTVYHRDDRVLRVVRRDDGGVRVEVMREKPEIVDLDDAELAMWRRRPIATPTPTASVVRLRKIVAERTTGTFRAEAARVPRLVVEVADDALQALPWEEIAYGDSFPPWPDLHVVVRTTPVHAPIIEQHIQLPLRILQIAASWTPNLSDAVMKVF